MSLSFKCRYGDSLGTIILHKNRRFEFSDSTNTVRGWFIKQSNGIFFQEDDGSFFRVKWSLNNASCAVCTSYGLTQDVLDSILGKVKTVCVVSNKHDYTSSYSTFVDSCDIVIRVNKMESQGTCLTGTKTDIVMVAVNDIYYSYTAEARKVDLLKKVPAIVLGRFSNGLIDKFKEEVGSDNVCKYPPFIWSKAVRMSSFGQAVVLALSVFPDAKVYFLGDVDCQKRTSFSKDVDYLKQVINYDDGVLSGLVARGRLLAPEVSDINNTVSAVGSMLDKMYGRNDNVDAISVVNPNNSDRIVLNGTRVARSYCKPYTGSLLYRGNGVVQLRWDGEDIVCTYLDAGGFYAKL